MKTMMTFVLALFFATAFCHGAEEVKQNEKPLDEVKKEIAEGKAIIIDVRGDGEWKAGHVKDATFYPITALKFGNPDLSKLPKDKTIYTYCAVGMRAKAAAAILNAKGYHASPLKEGFDDLSKNGFETTK